MSDLGSERQTSGGEGAEGTEATEGAQAAAGSADAAGAAADGAQPVRAAASAESALTDLRERVTQLEDQRLRALADLDNLRKRCGAQAARAAAEAGSSVAAQWLPVVDNLDRALAHSDSQGESDAVIAGVRAVRDQALALLAKLGFARSDDLGEMFDPTRHEAVATRRDPRAEPGTVVEVLQAGYGEGDHQLRPAQVIVAEREEDGAAGAG